MRVTLTFRLTKERRFVAVTDPLPAGFEAVESWFATTARDLASQQDRQTNDGGDASDWRTGGATAGSITSSVTTIASSCSPRGSREGLHEFSYIVARDDRRHVPHRAGAGRGDVRAGGVWPDRDRRSSRSSGKTVSDRNIRSRRRPLALADAVPSVALIVLLAACGCAWARCPPACSTNRRSPRPWSSIDTARRCTRRCRATRHARSR